MKLRRRLISITLILISILSACDDPTPTGTETLVPASTASNPIATEMATPQIIEMVQDTTFSFPSMVIAADESYSMIAEDIPGKGPCDPSLRRYKIPRFLLDVNASFRKRNMSSAETRLWYMGQKDVLDQTSNAGESLFQRLEEPPVPGEQGKVLFNDTFTKFSAYLDEKPNSTLIVITDGDLRENRPYSPNAPLEGQGTWQKLSDIKSKGGKVYIVLLCPNRLDQSGLDFWDTLDFPINASDNGNKQGLARHYEVWKDEDLQAVLKNLLGEILREAGWAPMSDQDFAVGYRVRGWDLLGMDEKHQFLRLPPQSLIVNYNTVSWISSENSSIETLLDGQPHSSVQSLVNPRFDCRNHVLSFIGQPEIFFYWWSVDMPVFWTKWNPESLYMHNMKGTMEADIRMLVKKSGSESLAAKELDDVSEQIDWTFWRRCTRFKFFNKAKQLTANSVDTYGGSVKLNEHAMVLDYDFIGKKAEAFEVPFSVSGEWISPNISLTVVAKDDVLFESVDLGAETIYNRYFPHFIYTDEVKDNLVTWNFEFFSKDYYPSEWSQDKRWIPWMEFTDPGCVIGVTKLEDPRPNESKVSYIFDQKTGLPSCKNLKLSWKNWQSDHDEWKSPPEVSCALIWEKSTVVKLIEINCIQPDK